jgi:hypothetical protein
MPTNVYSHIDKACGQNRKRDNITRPTGSPAMLRVAKYVTKFAPKSAPSTPKTTKLIMLAVLNSVCV